MEQFHDNKRYQPEDVIFQIGDMNNHVDPKTLMEAFNNYIKEFREKFGTNVKLISASLHLDEKTPHIHARRIFVYDNATKIGQNKALKELGIGRKNPNKEEHRYNNAKISFSEADRNLFLDKCEELGIDIERTPLKGKKRLEKLDYILSQKEKQVTELDEALKLAQKRMDCDNIEQALTVAKLEKIFDLLNDLPHDEVTQIMNDIQNIHNEYYPIICREKDIEK